MSILIKGMDMPKNEELIIICSDGTVEMTNNDGSRTCEQKAIELPPHRRLIEDTVLDDMSIWDTDREYDRGWNAAVRMARERIADAPTILDNTINQKNGGMPMEYEPDGDRVLYDPRYCDGQPCPVDCYRCPVADVIYESESENGK